ncbi:MAG TPA: acetamidase/formamidase family protein [Ktedonosporobacter sp.]|jgi:acetamidase/formamidase|nr:acetamidase/formamidase family protein [Ktedonosporobacter sp.]
MAVYTIEPERATLHGSFSRDFPPVLTIESGDTVHFRTLDAGWHMAPFAKGEVEHRRFEPRDPERDKGHALCGPVAIRGAQPGMTLEIRINEVRPGAWGWTIGGRIPNDVNRRLGLLEDVDELLWTLDAENLTGRDQYGHTIALHPFMGVMGMPPAEPGIHPTVPPRFCGGNMDCKELVAGSTLYLPIAVPGALFSTGDGHGAQGDGEVSGVAIECPIERVSLTFYLRDAMPIQTPRANTPAGWVTLGFNTDLHEATMIALDAMLNLMGEQYSISRPQALALASTVVDMHITQIVNGKMCGVHAVLPHGAIK